MKIYLAAPLFTPEQKRRISNVVACLREHGHEVFSPMEYNAPDAWSMSNNEWAANIFQHDLEGLKGSEAVVTLYEGFESDTGTAWELGYASATNKPICCLISETHMQYNPMVENHHVSLMIMQSATVVGNYEDYPKMLDLFLSGETYFAESILEQQ